MIDTRNNPFLEFGLRNIKSRFVNPDFTKQLQKFAVVADRRTKYVLQGVADDVVTNIIVGGEYAPGTPFKTGFARASWFISLQGESLHDVTKGFRGADFGGVSARSVISRDSLAIARKKIAQMGIGVKMVFYSVAAYIWKLEFGGVGGGGSTQAPNGMVRLTFAGIGSMIKRRTVEAQSIK